MDPGKIKKAIVKIQEGVKLGEQREGNLREQKENDEGVENPIMEREERDRRIGEDTFNLRLEAEGIQRRIRCRRQYGCWRRGWTD